jgi:hypothetical protein
MKKPFNPLRKTEFQSVKSVALITAACVIVTSAGGVTAKQLAATPTAPQSTAASVAVAPAELPAPERVIAEVPPARPQTAASPVASKPKTALPLAESATVRLASGLELIAFVSAEAVAPTKTHPTPLTLGVRVTNPTAQAQEFWPAKTQLMLRWGNGEWQAVGENSNRSALPHPVTVPAGATQTYRLADAKLAYIGEPLYLAFWSRALRAGAVYEKELKGTADQVAFAFEYKQDQPSPRTGEIICRLVATPEEAAAPVPAVNE